MEVHFRRVEYPYVAEKMIYENKFNLFYYGAKELHPITTFKDFTEAVANEVDIYEQYEIILK